METSRRTALKAAVWSAPAVVVVTAAPALASSGTHNVTQDSHSLVRDSGSVTQVGTLANADQTEDATVTVTCTLVCDSSGNGAGTYTDVAERLYSWMKVDGTQIRSEDGALRGYRGTYQTVVPAGATNFFVPKVSLTGLADSTLGTATVAFSVSSPYQPEETDSVRWPAYAPPP